MPSATYEQYLPRVRYGSVLNCDERGTSEFDGTCISEAGENSPEQNPQLLGTLGTQLEKSYTRSGEASETCSD